MARTTWWLAVTYGAVCTAARAAAMAAAGELSRQSAPSSA